MRLFCITGKNTEIEIIFRIEYTSCSQEPQLIAVLYVTISRNKKWVYYCLIYLNLANLLMLFKSYRYKEHYGWNCNLCADFAFAIFSWCKNLVHVDEHQRVQRLKSYKYSKCNISFYFMSACFLMLSAFVNWLNREWCSCPKVMYRLQNLLSLTYWKSV